MWARGANDRKEMELRWWNKWIWAIGNTVLSCYVLLLSLTSMDWEWSNSALGWHCNWHDFFSFWGSIYIGCFYLLVYLLHFSLPRCSGWHILVSPPPFYSCNQPVWKVTQNETGLRWASVAGWGFEPGSPSPSLTLQPPHHPGFP